MDRVQVIVTLAKYVSAAEATNHFLKLQKFQSAQEWFHIKMEVHTQRGLVGFFFGSSSWEDARSGD